MSISINAVAAAHTVASVIEGFAANVYITDGHGGKCEVRADRDYTELRFSGEDYYTAMVLIERPRRLYGEEAIRPTVVSWSSSSKALTGHLNAARTAELLNFAVDVARQLDRWANADQLPRLGGERQQAGMWSYAFEDAVENGRMKTVTIERPAELEHRELEELMERLGATRCVCTPPARVVEGQS